VVELPAINVLQGILGQIVSDCSQVQAQLSDILETQLVTNASINREQLDEAVL